ncbi:MAG: hypothetical protein AABX65_00070, partial [Nanoarchaeota archaeon]
MQKQYFHSAEQSGVSFKEPTTSESVSACAYDFEKLVKPQVLDPRWLQLGRILRASRGIWANLPKDAEGNLITDESTLNQYLTKAQKIKVGNGHIYLGDNDLGFAEYETFQRGVQDCDTFARGGLARLLEHTEEEVAKNLREIASPKLYKKGVNVWGFDSVNEPISRVVSLGSLRGFDDDWLSVSGGYWSDNDNGYAFGVL